MIKKELINKAINRFCSLVFPSHKIDLLTYSDTIKYFINSKPKDQRVVKGSVLIIPSKRNILTIWTFLDIDNNVVCNKYNIPYGRKLIAKSLDSELGEVFGENKLLIIE